MSQRPLDPAKTVRNVLKTSAATRVLAERAAPGIRHLTERAIECLLKLVDCVGPPPTDESAELFHFWARALLHSSGHTAIALSELLHSGFYLEASVLLRHMIEVLVQLRYFTKNQAKIKDHLTARRAKDRVLFKAMFSEIAPGYYGPYYAWSSGVAHGRVEAILLREERDGTRSRPQFGCPFDVQRLTMVANQWAAVLLGFLRSYPAAFPNTTLDDDGRNTLQSAIAGLNRWITAHWNEHDKARDWLRIMAPFILWTPPTQA